jgi:hypothetical protein
LSAPARLRWWPPAPALDGEAAGENRRRQDEPGTILVVDDETTFQQVVSTVAVG